MKATLTLIALLLSFAAHADNVRYVRLTAYVDTPFASQRLTVSSNELVELISSNAAQPHGGPQGIATEFSPDGTQDRIDLLLLGRPILGPGTVYLYQADAEASFCTLKVTTVNQEASPALPVIPAGASAVVGLEMSTDLKVWTPTTNGVVNAGSTNVFFRVRIDR